MQHCIHNQQQVVQYTFKFGQITIGEVSFRQDYGKIKTKPKSHKKMKCTNCKIAIRN